MCLLKRSKIFIWMVEVLALYDLFVYLPFIIISVIFHETVMKSWKTLSYLSLLHELSWFPLYREVFMISTEEAIDDYFRAGYRTRELVAVELRHKTSWWCAKSWAKVHENFDVVRFLLTGQRIESADVRWTSPMNVSEILVAEGVKEKFSGRTPYQDMYSMAPAYISETSE